jgi:hypothetical protein
MDEVAETFQQGFQDFLTALQERPLREHIGHTPVQVLGGGCAWGGGRDGVRAGAARRGGRAVVERPTNFHTNE